MLALILRLDYLHDGTLHDTRAYSRCVRSPATPTLNRTCYMTVPVRAMIFPFFLFRIFIGGIATSASAFTVPSASFSTHGFGLLGPDHIQRRPLRGTSFPATLEGEITPWLLDSIAMHLYATLVSRLSLGPLTSARWAVHCSDALDGRAPSHFLGLCCLARPPELLCIAIDHSPP